jgi:phage portal protein BeeE
MKPYVQAQKKTDYPDWYLAYARSMGYEWPDYSKLDKQLGLYKKLSSLYTAVKVIATIGAPVKQQVKRKQGEEKIAIPNHPLELLLDLPNPINSGYAFMRNTLRYLAMGRAYWWLNATSPTSPPSEVWLIPSNKIGPIADGNLGIKHYLYDPGDGRLLTIPPDEIIMLGEDDLLSPLKPFSAIETISQVAEGDLFMQRWNSQLFKGNARLPGVMAFADMIQNDQWDTIKEDITEAADKRNILMLRGVGQGQVNWIQGGTSPKELEFSKGRIENRNEIWNTFAQGLVSMLSENATEANARSGKATLIDLVVYPLLQYIGSELTSRILPRYGTGLIVEPEDIRVTDRVLELQEIAEYSKTHTVDEVREKYWKDKPIEDKEIGVLLVEVAQKGAQAVAEEEQAGDGLPTETAKPTTDVEAQQKQAAQKAVVKDPRPAMLELDKYERKAIKNLGKAFDFECYNVPRLMAEAIKADLPFCANAQAVKTIFDRARDELLDGGQGTGDGKPEAAPSELLVLAEALNNYARLDAQNAPILEAIKAMTRLPAEQKDDMQITINNPASVDMTSKETIAAVKAMTDNFSQLREAMNTQPAPLAPVVNINVPEQPAPVVNVTNEVNPTPVTIENNTTIQPADVKVELPPEKKKKVDIKVKRDAQGKIESAQGKIE